MTVRELLMNIHKTMKKAELYGAADIETAVFDYGDYKSIEADIEKIELKLDIETLKAKSVFGTF